jgi:hypothetical protein
MGAVLETKRSLRPSVSIASTKRCWYYKDAKECSIHYHNYDYDCSNLSGLAICTEALVERPKQKRARADTVGNSI